MDSPPSSKKIPEVGFYDTPEASEICPRRPVGDLIPLAVIPVHLGSGDHGLPQAIEQGLVLAVEDPVKIVFALGKRRDSGHFSKILETSRRESVLMSSMNSKEKALLGALRAEILQRMPIRRAAELLGYENAKQLYNRLAGVTQMDTDEKSRIMDWLGVEYAELLVKAKLIPPSLQDVPGLLRYYAGRDEPEDERLCGYLVEPPDPVGGEAEDVGVPARFLELEELRAKNPRRLPEILDRWLDEAYLAASLGPTPATVVEYCSALDLKAAQISGRGYRIDAALLIAHALELCPSDQLFRGYLWQHSAASLRRIGPPEVALALARQATGEAVALGSDELEARCLLMLGTAYGEFGTEAGNAKAGNAYRKVVKVAPTGRYALAAAVNWSFILIGRGRPAEALAFSGSIEERIGKAYPSMEFHRVWIRGKAYFSLELYEEAIECFESALRSEPQARDPVNLLLVLDGLRQVPIYSFDRLADWAHRLTPCFRRIEVESPNLAKIARRVMVGMIERKASQQMLDAWMQEFRKKIRRSQP